MEERWRNSARRGGALTVSSIALGRTSTGLLAICECKTVWRSQCKVRPSLKKLCKYLAQKERSQDKRRHGKGSRYSTREEVRMPLPKLIAAKYRRKAFIGARQRSTNERAYKYLLSQSYGILGRSGNTNPMVAPTDHTTGINAKA